jgi:hypothetical protein
VLMLVSIAHQSLRTARVREKLGAAAEVEEAR